MNAATPPAIAAITNDSDKSMVHCEVHLALTAAPMATKPTCPSEI